MFIMTLASIYGLDAEWGLWTQITLLSDGKADLDSGLCDYRPTFFPLTTLFLNTPLSQKCHMESVV